MATATVAPPVRGGVKENTWTPDAKGWAARIGVLVAIFGLILFLTGRLGEFEAFLISEAAIFSIIALSLNIVLGYVGQVSLGHHGFVGIAAFVAAHHVTTRAGCSPESGCSMGGFVTGLLLAAFSGAVAAGILGLVALRIKGLYLALITLAYGFVAETSIFEISFLTRGGSGMPAARPKVFISDTRYAFLCMAILALVIFLDWRLIKSKAGRAILSLKHSEPVASSYGINVTNYKVIAFVMSGLFAGIAGGLLAFRLQNVVANDFQFASSLLWVLMVVVGGLGSRTGVVIGGAFFALFPHLLEAVPGGEHFFREVLGRNPAYIPLVVGPFLAILTLIQFPGGIAQQISPITRWLRGERFSVHPDGHHKEKKQKHSSGGSPKTALLSRLGLHRGETTTPAEEAPTEEIKQDAEPVLHGQPEEPGGAATGHDDPKEGGA